MRSLYSQQQENVEDKSEGGPLTNFHRPRAVMVPPRNPQKFPENKEDMTLVVCSLTTGGLRVAVGPYQKSTSTEKLRNGISNHAEVVQEMGRDFWDDRTVLLPPKQSRDDVAPKPLLFAKGANLNACRHMGKVFLLSSRVQIAKDSDVRCTPRHLPPSPHARAPIMHCSRTTRCKLTPLLSRLCPCFSAPADDAAGDGGHAPVPARSFQDPAGAVRGHGVRVLGGVPRTVPHAAVEPVRAERRTSDATAPSLFALLRRSNVW